MGQKYSKDIEKVQTDLCRYNLGVNSSVNKCMVLGECGRVPLSYIQFTKCIKYWCTLLQMSDTHYPKKCYKMLMLHDDIGRTNWVTNIKDLLL